jgi:alpha-L-rhamnosidase
MRQLANIFLFAFCLLGNLTATWSQVSTANLRTEYHSNPLGIGERQPRLSWEIQSKKRDVMQTAYQIRVAGSDQDLNKGKNLFWDSGKVTTDQSNQVAYAGIALGSRQRCYWQVRVWDNHGNDSGWSNAAWWELGLLSPADWKAEWISADKDEDKTKSQPCPMFRKTFRLDGEVRSARAYVTALGLYEAEINGQKITDEIFTPGWTSYKERLQYQTFDVTRLLKKGDNAIGVTLADGWYRGNIGWEGHRNHYGKDLALLFQLEITYANGKTATVLSDGSWKTATGPILESDIYNGEVYDARLERKGWSSAGYKDSDWGAVKTMALSKDILVAPQGVPVRRIGEIKPVKIIRTPKGEMVYDFGQNMVGRVRLKVTGPAGTTISVEHAEVLDKQGNFYTANMRSAKTRLQYILKGGGEEVYEPSFTFMGFRYIKLEGLPGTPALDNVTGIVIHSDMTPTGDFECSNPLLNQLQHNIQWGQKGNFLDVPTDCPQRDERMGWTGDAQAFSRTANFNFDCAAFYTKWLADLAADQGADGNVPFVVPDVLTNPEAFGGAMAGGATGWADVATIMPWHHYLAYGDTRLLERQYESMKAWVGYMEKQAGDDYVYDSGFHFGDWLFYSVNDDRDGRSAITDKYFITQTFFAHSTDILRKTAEILGKNEDAARYASLLEKVKNAFNKEHVTANGRLSSATQTAYVLALQFDLLPEHLRAQAAQRLVKNIVQYENHLTTGFLGTPYITEVLTRFGYLDVAYKLLLQETWPSWLYPVKMGATTIWERWDGIKPDSTFQEASMNSFNHYAYGAIGDWLYRTVAGIDMDEKKPGYKHIIMSPQPGGKLTNAKARYHSIYGDIESAWTLSGNEMQWQVTVPANTTATLRFPKAVVGKVTENGKSLSRGQGIHSFRQDGDAVEVMVGSGVYQFQH